MERSGCKCRPHPAGGPPPPPSSETWTPGSQTRRASLSAPPPATGCQGSGRREVGERARLRESQPCPSPARLVAERGSAPPHPWRQAPAPQVRNRSPRLLPHAHLLCVSDSHTAGASRSGCSPDPPPAPPKLPPQVLSLCTSPPSPVVFLSSPFLAQPTLGAGSPRISAISVTLAPLRALVLSGPF